MHCERTRILAVTVAGTQGISRGAMASNGEYTAAPSVQDSHLVPFSPSHSPGTKSGPQNYTKLC